MKINDSFSNACYTNCGVLQGSVLGPLLFLIYVNDIAESIGSSISLFADNTALSFSSRCPLHLHQVLTRDLHTLSNLSRSWNINFNPAKTKILTIFKPHPVLTFNNFDLSETDSCKYLGLVFRWTLSWHHHNLSIKQKTTLTLNHIKQLSHLVPRKVLYTLYVSCVLPILEYGNMVFAIFSTSDKSLLENIHTNGAKIVLGYFRTSRKAAVLSDLNLIPLSNRRDLHMLLFFYKIKTGLVSPVFHLFLLLTLGEISAYSFRHDNNFQLPLAKRSLVHNSFFYKAPVFWNSLPQYIKLSSSFSAIKNRITLFYHGKNRNIWHLQGSNPSATSLRCMFRLGHSPLNINMKFFWQRSCGSTETLEHLLLQCNSTLHNRNVLLLTLKNALLNEKNYNQQQYSTITNKTLIHILLFGHPKLSFKPTVVVGNPTVPETLRAGDWEGLVNGSHTANAPLLICSPVTILRKPCNKQTCLTY